MTLKITAFFFDSTVSPQAPAVGMSPQPTIRVRELDGNTLVVTDELMTEVGDGFYVYDFGAGSPEIYDPSVEYSARAFAAALAEPRDRYAQGAFGNDDIDIDIHYTDGIHVDTTGGGVSGTTYPIGTRQNPVDNVTDMRVIAEANNVKHIFLRGSITLNNTFIGYIFEALAGGGSVDGGSQDAGGSIFNAVGITGIFNSTSDMFGTAMAFFGTMTNWRGTAVRPGLGGTIICAPGQVATFAQGASVVAGVSTPEIQVAGAGTQLNLRAYSGGMFITNMDDPTSNASLEFTAGQCVIDATNIAGTIVIRGLVYLTDSRGSPQAALVKQGFLDPRGKVDIEQ